MSEWQPIESAPKDGTRVLLWASGWRHPFVGHASTEPNMAWLDVPTPTATQIEVFTTHWQPLPESPSANEKPNSAPI